MFLSVGSATNVAADIGPKPPVITEILFERVSSRTPTGAVLVGIGYCTGPILRRLDPDVT
jgi:hypothetical protein